MTAQSAERARAFLRSAVPSLAVMVLILILSLPFALPSFGQLHPLVEVMAVYYWSVYKADWMPALGAFLVGLFSDLISGNPLGLMALTLVILQWSATGQSRSLIAKSFLANWLGFSVMAAGAMMFIWVIGCIYFLHLFDLRPQITQWLITVFSYPLLHGLFSGLRHWLQQQD